MKSKTKTLPTDAVLRDMLKQAGLDSAGVQFRLLALIQEVEKYYRFTPLSQGWMVDIGGASVAYKAAFAALRRG